MTVSYLTGPSSKSLSVDINGKNTGTVYYLPESQPLWQANILDIQVTLNKGKNLIKFYTNNGIVGPWIGVVNIEKVFFIDAIYVGNATLKGSSTNNNGIIVYSGFGVGDISFNVTNVPKAGQYNLMIRYSCPVPANNVYIHVNGKYIGQVQSFFVTSSINSIAYKMIPVNLNQGNNTITIS
ncbi:CBM35 domain-containing protein [Clostridium massiliodielmoense]|uniref:CBM35 domain-containing protein n=1 Tax=Clostridium massiliodielmoense TaxID=1776385 RepID=UPI0004D6A55E|nr:CBM35 domain-containing protein [Clostridium massiliodielmoense]KEH98854.1 hypothetical protein Z962_10015 [Clostridium botulinum C/D str. BKT12695]